MKAEQQRTRQLRGMVVPLVTPLLPDQSLDEEGLRRVVGYVLDGGVHGVFVNSTTGEGLCLLEDQRRRALEIVARVVDGRVPVLVNVGGTSTRNALRELRLAVEGGADGVVAHPPYLYPINDQQEILNFYRALADSSPLPVFVYNLPMVVGASISLAVLEELVTHPQIAGIKDSSADFVYLTRLIELKQRRPDFRIFIGKSHLWAAGIWRGADGGLDGVSNVVPRLCVELFEAVEAGDLGRALELQRRIDDVWKLYQCRSFLAAIKMAVSKLGLCGPTVSSPILNLSEDEERHVEEVLRRNGLLREESSRRLDPRSA
ncbi:MAG: dihydrodipicolinate synthase family protein [candidate division KSB1 bacterium]|nr:dihydrodipicolinate synthase family protein [candidate division KSB1 bacterium]